MCLRNKAETRSCRARQRAPQALFCVLEAYRAIWCMLWHMESVLFWWSEVHTFFSFWRKWKFPLSAKDIPPSWKWKIWDFKGGKFSEISNNRFCFFLQKKLYLYTHAVVLPLSQASLGYFRHFVLLYYRTETVSRECLTKNRRAQSTKATKSTRDNIFYL